MKATRIDEIAILDLTLLSKHQMEIMSNLLAFLENTNFKLGTIYLSFEKYFRELYYSSTHKKTLHAIQGDFAHYATSHNYLYSLSQVWE